MSNVSREGFADEAGWLEYQHNLAEMVRRERIRQNAPRVRRPKRSERVRKALMRPKWRAHTEAWASANPVRLNEIRHASHRRRRAHRLAGMRDYNHRTHEQRALYDQMYYQDNRASILARKAAERAARKARQEAMASGATVYVSLSGLKPGTVFRVRVTGECGYVVMYQRSKGTVHVDMEAQGSVQAEPNTQVEVLAEPWELAAAYVRNSAIRALVTGTMQAIKREAVHAMSRILGGV